MDMNRPRSSCFRGHCATNSRVQLKRREVPDFLDVPVETVQFPELINQAARRLVWDVTGHRIWEWAETSFDHKVAQRWAGKAPCLYGCEHASVETFSKSRKSLAG